MRVFINILIIGIIFLFHSSVRAEEYRVLVLPDNIASDNEVVDSYIYNSASEFFANEIINILNGTDYIKSPTVSEERYLLKNNPSNLVIAKNLTNKFKTAYNVDFVQVKKIADKSKARYVLMLTSSIDSENYILRRTVWDVMNIPGASVIDPAYKINTYAVLIDTHKNLVLWSNTFYKTISTVENRIITRGPSPQTEQLQKIRDYSRMLCPEIAQNVQLKILPAEIYSKETHQIYYDMGNFDNVFTKKYRRWYKEGSKDYAVAKERVETQVENAKVFVNETAEKTKTKYKEFKEDRAKKLQEKNLQKQLEVKAEPINDVQIKPEFSIKNETKNFIHNINFKKPALEDESLYLPIEIKPTRKNNLYGDFDNSRPPLRDYN